MMKVLRFFIGRGELADTVGSAPCQLCLDPRSFQLLVIEFVSLVTTILWIVICHAAAVATLQRINLVFWLLVGITRWIFAPRFFWLGKSLSLSCWLRSPLRPRPSRRLRSERSERSGEYDVFLQSELQRLPSWRLRSLESDLARPRSLWLDECDDDWMNVMMIYMDSF